MAVYESCNHTHLLYLYTLFCVTRFTVFPFSSTRVDTLVTPDESTEIAPTVESLVFLVNPTNVLFQSLSNDEYCPKS